MTGRYTPPPSWAEGFVVGAFLASAVTAAVMLLAGAV